MSDQQEMGPTNAPAYAARTIGQIRLHDAWRHELAYHCPKSRLFWLTRGTTRITADLHPIMATGPKMLFIPASMLLSIELPTQLQGQLAYFPNLADLELPQTSLCLTPSSAEAQVEMTGLIERMARLEDQDTPSARPMKRGYGLLLKAMLERERLISSQRDRDATHRLRTQIKKPSISAQLLSRFAALLAQGFNAQLGVSDYAARLDVTPTHLTRNYREITGRTALALINELLMAEARRRLVDTHDSAAKIARDLGYSSPAYFTRAFGQETGTTPTGYRDQKQGQWSARATDSPCFT